MTATTAPTRTGWQLPRLHGLPWVTWRQHRFALAGTVVALGGFGILMLINGLAMHSDYASLGLNTCGKFSDPACDVPLRIFQHEWGNWAQQLPQFLTFLPGLLGVFVGAPVVARELESGTFRFAWTQGRNRVQWITTKLVLLGVTLTVLALAFSALFTWWYGPFGTLLGRMGSGGAYEVTGIVFAARTLFGFMLGALLGTLIRRTVPAMAATAAGWLAVTWPSVVYLRPLIQTPITTLDGRFAASGGGWVIKTWAQDAAGHHPQPGSTVRSGARQRGRLARQVPSLDGPAPLHELDLLPARKQVLALPDRRGVRLRRARAAPGRRDDLVAAPPRDLVRFQDAGFRGGAVTRRGTAEPVAVRPASRRASRPDVLGVRR